MKALGLFLVLISNLVFAEKLLTSANVICPLYLDYLGQARDRNPILTYEEYMKSSDLRERVLFERLFYRILAAQHEFALADGGKAARGQHKKILGGGIISEIEILPGIPDFLKYGLFTHQAGTRLVALSRFSRGMGVLHPDGLPDVTGYALQILRGHNPIEAWNITFTNSVSAFAEDPMRFMDFMEVQASGLLGKIGKGSLWAFNNPLAAYRLLSTVAIPVSSTLLQTYGSGHPYVVGPGAVKFSVALEKNPPPGSVDPKRILEKVGGLRHPFRTAGNIIGSPEYLSDDLQHWLSVGSVSLTLYAHPLPNSLEGRAAIRWVENGLEKAKSKGIPVLRIRLLQNGITPESTQIAERVTWNPGNYFMGHRPAGRIGRGRSYAYPASALGRWAEDEEDPERLMDNLTGRAFQNDYQSIIQLHRRLTTQP